MSGASTGLGAATTRTLAERGFHVLAGVRREQDGERLRQAGAEPVNLDVTHAEDIARLAARIDASGKPLRAVVNNAGLAANAPVETLPLEDWRAVFDVNVFGAVALTQALLPALHRSSGRVVNITSIGGKVAMPAFGAYSGSKFALEAISDSLRQELAPHGVQVVIVEPGGMRTEMGSRGTSAAEGQLERMTPRQRDLYGETMSAFLGYAAALDRTGITADEAARTVMTAITAARPRTRYTIGREAALLSRLIRFVSDRTLDRMITRTLRSQTMDTAAATA
ncbi:SDR family NAD(P)-dependent oxidoreductase [Isoptericola halotolerans]|uniref:NAD(P)-dependent dehydrogenase (Short-subunit alcohol dehydrogenase family) n=1 Tax=Isoptericola halotolerans TaxID=300560 RepID=A0ABX1ZZT8_9MICO|nr:NAD(P)-dependent dehydrogenase (short-subunit alcohol dehydrogenase family) [Isoptericola halotolerans]